MSNTGDSSLSLGLQLGSEASTSENRTFTVEFKPAHHFLAGLMVLLEMNTTAAMIVKNGGIQLSATSTALSAYATFLMLEASTAASWTTNSFALSFDTSNWRTLLRIHSINQKFESIWIYKIAGSPDLYCLVGEDPEPIKLGESEFVEEGGIDLGNLAAKRNVSINLKSQCLREVITTFSPKFQHVLMMVKSDSIIWHHISKTITHSEENGDCIIEGVEPGDVSYLLIVWRDPLFLMLVSWLALDVCICRLDDPHWTNWIMFTFNTSENTCFFYMFRWSDSRVILD